MLVLSRKKGERIRIGPDIEIVVFQLSKNRVRVGISAPADVPVHRHELALRLAGEMLYNHPAASEALETEQVGTLATPRVTERSNESFQQT